MARGEHEAVAVEPGVVLGVVRHRLAVDDVPHGGAAHGETGVAGVGLVDGVDGEEAHGVLTQSMTVSAETSAGAASAARTGFTARAETRAETFFAFAVTFAPAKEALRAAIWEAAAAIFP